MSQHMQESNMLNVEQKSNDKTQASPLGEQGESPLSKYWPHLGFLGLGVWWAWIWIVFYSPALAPADITAAPAFSKTLAYSLSTVAILVCTICIAIFWKKLENPLNNTKFIVAAGLIGSLATVCVGYITLNVYILVIAYILTGIATSFLSARVGILYSTVDLRSSLTAGALSLVVLCILFFTAIGMPHIYSTAFAACMPLLSGLLMCLNIRYDSQANHEQFDFDESANGEDAGAEYAEGTEGTTRAKGFAASASPTATAVVSGTTVATARPDSHNSRALESLAAKEQQNTPSIKKAVSSLYVRLVLAWGLVALSAGFGSGISAIVNMTDDFSYESANVVAAIGIVGMCIVWYLNRRKTNNSAPKVLYRLLMTLGVAMSLAICLGMPVAYMNIGKSILWCLFICLMSTMAFKFDLSSIRTFAWGQAVYFLGTLLGWLLGAVVAPYYFDSAVRLPVGLCMAFAIVCVMMFLFTERDVLLITQTSDEIYSALANTNKFVEGATPDSDHEPDPEDLKAMRLDNFAKMYGLSARETGIMVLFAAGRSAEWIASKEVISKNTVRTHLRSVYSKLDVHSRQELLDKLAEFNL